MICCAIGLLLIAQWLAWFRAARRVLVRWRWLIVASMLLVGVQTSAFAWHLWQPQPSFEEITAEQLADRFAAGPLCGARG
ncbi:MAG: hypothetical protein P1U78_08830 [Alcanivoracaceae bacterium]|nr:hypothetical protein [Alcanivoracaceae bacterium]